MLPFDNSLHGTVLHGKSLRFPCQKHKNQMGQNVQNCDPKNSNNLIQTPPHTCFECLHNELKGLYPYIHQSFLIPLFNPFTAQIIVTPQFEQENTHNLDKTILFDGNTDPTITTVIPLEEKIESNPKFDQFDQLNTPTKNPQKPSQTTLPHTPLPHTSLNPSNSSQFNPLGVLLQTITTGTAILISQHGIFEHHSLSLDKNKTIKTIWGANPISKLISFNESRIFVNNIEVDFGNGLNLVQKKEKKRLNFPVQFCDEIPNFPTDLKGVMKWFIQQEVGIPVINTQDDDIIFEQNENDRNDKKIKNTPHFEKNLQNIPQINLATKYSFILNISLSESQTQVLNVLLGPNGVNNSFNGGGNNQKDQNNNKNEKNQQNGAKNKHLNEKLSTFYQKIITIAIMSFVYTIIGFKSGHNGVGGSLGDGVKSNIERHETKDETRSETSSYPPQNRPVEPSVSLFNTTKPEFYSPFQRQCFNDSQIQPQKSNPQNKSPTPPNHISRPNLNNSPPQPQFYAISPRLVPRKVKNTRFSPPSLQVSNVSSGVGGARGVGGVGGVGDASNINSEVGGVLNVNSGVGGLNKNKDGNMPGHDEIYDIKCLDNMKGVGKMPTIDHFDQIDRNFFQKGPDLLISTNNDSSQLLPPPATLFRLDCMQVMLGNSMGIGVEKVEKVKKVKKVKKDGLFDFPPLQPDNHDCSSHRPSYFGINIKDRVNSTMGGDKIEKNVQNVRKKSIYRRKSGNKVDNDVMNTNNNANIEKMTKLTHLKAKYDIFVTKGGIARLVGLGIYNAGYRLGEEERLTLTSQFLQKKSQVLMQQRPFFPIFTRRSPCLSQESIFKSLFHTINELFCNDRFISIDYPTIITPQLLNNFGSQFPHKKQQFLDEKFPKFQTNSHICSPPSDQFNHHSTLCKSSYKNVFQIDKKFLFVSGLIPLTITFPGLLIPATNRENQHKIDQHDQHNQHNQNMVQMKVGKESGVDGGSGLVHGDQIGVAMAQNRNKRGSIDQIGVGEGQVKGDCTGFGVDGGNLGYNGLNKNVNPKKPSIYSRSRSGKGKLQCENSQNGGNNKFAQNGNYECPKKPFKFTMFHTAHIMIDQHAADERIRLEAITDIFLNEFKNRFVEKYFPQNEKNGEKNDEKSKNLKENCGDFFEKLDYVQPAAQFNQHRHPLSLSSFQGRGKQKIDQQIAEKSKGNVVEKPPSTHFTPSHGELTGKNAQVLKRKNVYELNRVGKNDKNSPQKNNSKNHFCDKKTNAFKKFKHGKYAQSDIISLLDDDNSDCVCIDDYCEVVGDDRGSIKPNLTSPRKDNNTINNDNNNRTDNRDAKGNSYKNKNKNCDNNSDNKNKNDETYRFLGLNNTNNTPLVNIPSDSIDNDLFISKDELSKVKFDDFDQNSWVDENRRGFGDKAKGSNRIGDNTSINGQNMGNVLGKKISVSQFATDLLLLLDKQIDEKIWCNFKLVEKIEVTIPISLIKIFEENQPFLRLFGFEWMELQDRFVIPSGKSVRDKDNMIFDQNGLQKRQIYIELIQVPKILGFSLKNTHFLLLLSEISTQNFILPNIITIEKNYNTVNELVFSLEYIPKFVIDILNLAACRGAQKFNQKMCSNAMGMLLNDLIQCKNPLICAHGRPTTMLILPQYLEGGRNGGKFQGKDGFNFQNDFFFGVNFLKVVLFLLKFYYKIRKLYLIEQNRTGNLTNGLKSAWVRQNNYEFIQDDCFDKKIANILIFLEGQNWFEKEFFSHFAANFVHFSHFSNSSPHIPKQTDGSTPNQNKRGVEDQCRGTGCVYWRCRNREGFSGR